MSEWKQVRGKIYQGPQRVENTEGGDIDILYIKAIVSDELALVKGEPALFGGVYYETDNKMVQGRWIPLTFPTSELARLGGWPKVGNDVIIYYTGRGENDEFYAVPIQYTFPEDEQKKWGWIDSVIVYIG